MNTGVSGEGAGRISEAGFFDWAWNAAGIVQA